MQNKIALQEFKAKPLIYLSTLVFISLAAALLSAVFLLSFTLSGSINQLMDDAKTPDYLQMHQGDLDFDKLENFAKNNPLVSDWQVLDFLNIDGQVLIINGQSQEGASQDNGLVTQSDSFDFLLDLENKVIEPEPGELYLPLMFYKDGSCEQGDPVVIAGKSFVVNGFFRDSQMNSNLAGSKRILLHQEDYAELYKEGKPEYLIEFLLNDKDRTSEFEKAYQEQVGAVNGPAITYSMFRMINALNDGMLIAILIITSVVILLITLFCLRFTLLAKMEEEFREIAVLKAIGLPHKSIKSLSLHQYGLLCGVAVLLGYLLSLLLQNSLLADMRLYMGEGGNTQVATIFALLAPILLALVLILYVSRKLNLIRNISPVTALRGGESGILSTGTQKEIPPVKLERGPLALASSYLKSRIRLYSSVFFVVVLTVFLVLVPTHLATTLLDPNFKQSLGMGDADLIIEVHNLDNLKEKSEEILQDLAQDERVEVAEVAHLQNLETKTSSGQEIRLKTALGEHQAFPIQYSQGHAPETEEQIVLSELYIDELELKLGDKLQITANDETREVELVGIYADISNGGKTAKAIFSSEEAIAKSSILIKCQDYKDAEALKADLNKKYGMTKISTIADYVDQAFGPLKKQITTAAVVAALIATAVLALVIHLTVKLLITKDAREVAIFQSLGFSNARISHKYLRVSLLLGIPAVILGLILANTLGKLLAGSMIKSFGASALNIIVNPLIAYLLCPLWILVILGIFTLLGTRDIKKLKLRENINLLA